MTHFADRLAEAVRSKGPLCVGIDPRIEQIPTSLRKRHEQPWDAIEAFSLRVLDLVQPFTGVIKPQAAFFEMLGPEGFRVMQRVLCRCRELGLMTILDAKRGDIASTATAYAEAAFGPVWDADALTVNPYLGADAIEPFVSQARQRHRGLFVLVRTSNPGGGLFQNLLCDGKPLYRRVAEAVVAWNEGSLGQCGLGDVGAVVGATHPSELRELRALMPAVWFLVPGYGAQGGTADDVRAARRSDGLGSLVNSSRGVTFPFHPDDPDWENRILQAAENASRELRD